MHIPAKQDTILSHNYRGNVAEVVFAAFIWKLGSYFQEQGATMLMGVLQYSVPIKIDLHTKIVKKMLTKT